MFLSPIALAVMMALPTLPTDFGDAPRELEAFMQYMIQRRSAEGLNRVVTDPEKENYGTIYGGGAEDANVAWIAASAYRYEWSRFHRNADLRERACFLIDSLVGLRPDGNWDDGGLGSYFMLQSLAWAMLSWLETGDIEPERAAQWREAVRLVADDAMVGMHYRFGRPGLYANPEFYYMAGLAAAWKITGEERYREEGRRVLERYDSVLWEGGGLPYFHESAPDHGYQSMVVKSVALFWDLTQDPLALDWLHRMAPYYPNTVHRSGIMSDAENPWLKHTLYRAPNPAAPAMVAAAIGEGQNRWVADVMTPLWADNVQGRLASFFPGNPHWYNYHLTTWAAGALRLMERGGLPAAEAPPAQRVFTDHSFRGVRSHWDDFTAVATTWNHSDSLAGAHLADHEEPFYPLNAALDGAFFEVLKGDRSPEAPAHIRGGSQYRALGWNPEVTQIEAEGFAAVSCLSGLYAPYWNDMPWLAGEAGRTDNDSGWTAIQHWAVWRDHLIGLGSLRCHVAGGDPATEDMAQVRWQLAPSGRELHLLAAEDDQWRLRYGGLQFDLRRLAERGGFHFAALEVEPTERAGWHPTLRREGPWNVGDVVHLATHVRPQGAEGEVLIKPLHEGAAALLVEPGGRRAYLWVTSLFRHWRNYNFEAPAEVEVRLQTKPGELVPPHVPGLAYMVPLMGASSAVAVLESEGPLPVQAIYDSIRAGHGRTGAAPQ